MSPRCKHCGRVIVVDQYFSYQPWVHKATGRTDCDLRATPASNRADISGVDREIQSRQRALRMKQMRDKGASLRAIGREFDVTPERVRQILGVDLGHRRKSRPMRDPVYVVDGMIVIARAIRESLQ